MIIRHGSNQSKLLEANMVQEAEGDRAVEEGDPALLNQPEVREFVRTDKKRINAPVNVGVPKADRPPSDGPPKPMFLSKTATEEKNDPLWRDAIFSEP